MGFSHLTGHLGSVGTAVVRSFMHPKSTPKCFTAVLHNVLVIVLPVPPQKDKACLSREPGLVTKNEGEGGGRSRKLQPLFFTSCYSPYIPVAQTVKRLPTMRETWVLSLGREFPIPWRRKWQPTPVCLLGKCPGQRSLMAYSPWDYRESDTIEHTGKVCYATILWQYR